MCWLKARFVKRNQRYIECAFSIPSFLKDRQTEIQRDTERYRERQRQRGGGEGQRAREREREEDRGKAGGKEGENRRREGANDRKCEIEIILRKESVCE